MVWRVMVVIAVCGAFACGPRIRRCTEGCPQESTCDAASGFCVRSTPDAGVTDSGVDAGRTDAGVIDAGCDIFGNGGCSSNERCGVAIFDAGTGALTCLPPGAKGEGDSCAFSSSSGRTTDDCEGTLVCASINGCRTACDDNHACAAGFECLRFDFGLASLIGGCVPKCDPVSQRLINDGGVCGPGLECAGYPETGGLCIAERNPANAHGATAPNYLNGCAAGAMPMTFDGGRVCAALCRPAEVHSGQTANAGGLSPNTCASRGAANATCRFWNLYRPDLVGTLGLSDWGYCSDPAFEQLPACTALDAGDHLNYGCGPR